MAETGLVERLNVAIKELREMGLMLAAKDVREAADALATKEAECVAYVKAVDEWVELYAKNGAPPTKDAPHGRLDWLLTTMNGIAVQRLERLRALEAECGELRRALQRIANLPLQQADHIETDPEVRARRIAVTALGGDPQTIKHLPPDDKEPLFVRHSDAGWIAAQTISALQEQVRGMREALLEAEITKATPSSQATFGGATPDPWYDPYMKSLDRISALQEQVRGMREALKPFAEFAKKIPEAASDKRDYAPFTASDFRRAKAALTTGGEYGKETSS